MLGIRNKKVKEQSLLQAYGSQMGRIAERNRAELALVIAKQDADKSAELARKAMLDAQAANRAKTEFLANMSHESRTPLNAIIGFSDMMKSKMLGPTGGDKFLEYAKDINDSGQHLLELINDILDLAKIESGKLELYEQNINVNRITKSCLILIKERANEGRLSVHDRLPGNAPALRADERKFKQIMINLLSNAVKFTPAGGEIVVDGLIDRDRSFAITVSDTGKYRHRAGRYLEGDGAVHASRKRPRPQVRRHRPWFVADQGVRRAAWRYHDDRERSRCGHRGNRALPGGAGDRRCGPIGNLAIVRRRCRASVEVKGFFTAI